MDSHTGDSLVFAMCLDTVSVNEIETLLPAVQLGAGGLGADPGQLGSCNFARTSPSPSTPSGVSRAGLQFQRPCICTHTRDTSVNTPHACLSVFFKKKNERRKWVLWENREEKS